jgi:hypothetical protein
VFTFVKKITTKRPRKNKKLIQKSAEKIKKIIQKGFGKIKNKYKRRLKNKKATLPF